MTFISGLTDTQLRATPLPVSGTVTANISGSVAVTGGLTDTQLRASAIAVSGTVTANAGTGTFAISAAALPLPTGAATETTLAAISTKTPALGQATMANSSPVVIASNQSAVPVSISGSGDVVATGSISATDAVVAAPGGSGAFVSGTSTANSYVSVATGGGTTSFAVQVTGVTVANLFFEVSFDSTNGIDGNWMAVNARQGGITLSSGSYSITATANGLYRGNIGAAKYFRVRNVGTLTGTAAIVIRLSTGSDIVNVTGALAPNQSVDNARVAGNALAVNNGTASTGCQRVVIASDNTAFTVNTTPTTPTASTLNSAASTNSTLVKGSAGTLYSISASNNGAAIAFLKLYNKATAPTVGTDTPVLIIPIPASGAINFTFGTQGQRFATGIGLGITTMIADADTTAVAAGQVKLMTSYI